MDLSTVADARSLLGRACRDIVEMSVRATLAAGRRHIHFRDRVLFDGSFV